MRTISYLVVGLILITQISCKKETVIPPTQAEAVSAQLQELVRTEKVDRVICLEYPNASFSNTTILGDYGSKFKFEKSFVIVEGVSWNLLYLKKYEIRVLAGNIKYLGLYF
jgi:hypothetical protein